MFGVYFGKYLTDVGALTKEQYIEVVEESRSQRVKLGLIAVSEGLMTEKQANEINMLQQSSDKRFGDLAIEKGYLNDEQLGRILSKQGDSYLLFVQILTEKNYLSLDELQRYLNNFKRAERFTSLDIAALKSSDIDHIIPLYTKGSDVPIVVKDYLALLARNIVRFVDNKVRFEKICRVNSYTTNAIASQNFSGDREIFIGLCGEGNLVVGSKFGQEDFEVVDEDCLDAVCEFINVTNGLFASQASKEDIEIDMLPPMMYTKDTTIENDGQMFVLPCFVDNKRVDIVICMESKWQIN